MMTKWIVESKDGKNMGLPTKILRAEHIKSISSPMSWKILQAITEKPMYPKEIAKKLRIHEQKVYYHVRNLAKAGIIRVSKQENMHGVIAKFYDIDQPAFAVALREMQEMQKLPSPQNEFLHPHIKDGKLETLIVVGSLESHGPEKVKARDAPFAINLGLFLGSFLGYMPSLSVRIDTELQREEMKNNMIVVGGPAVNKIAGLINSKLPINFKTSQKQGNFYSTIFSSLSKKTYDGEEIGLIVKAKNPFDESKSVMLLAGRRSQGTKAAIIALMKNFEEVCAGNRHNPKVFAKVVEGIDSDSDGVVDSVEIKE